MMTRPDPKCKGLTCFSNIYPNERKKHFTTDDDRPHVLKQKTQLCTTKCHVQTAKRVIGQNCQKQIKIIMTLLKSNVGKRKKMNSRSAHPC